MHLRESWYLVLREVFGARKKIWFIPSVTRGREDAEENGGRFLIEDFHRLSVSSFQDKPLDFALTLISDKCLRFTLAFNKAAGDHYPVTTLYSTDTIS